MSTANKHRVPSKQWRKWSDVAKAVFNEVFSQMQRNVDLFQHPKAKTPPKTHWRTTSWNAAWVAADAADGMHGD